MQKKKESKKTAPSSVGKRSTRRAAYYAACYPRNKLRRILRHNGEGAAKNWASAHGAEVTLVSMMRKPEFKGITVRLEKRALAHKERAKKKKAAKIAAKTAKKIAVEISLG